MKKDKITPRNPTNGDTCEIFCRMLILCSYFEISSSASDFNLYCIVLKFSCKCCSVYWINFDAEEASREHKFNAS